MNLKITSNDVFNFIRRLLEFPRPEICRHYVAAILLQDFLERKGFPVDSIFCDLVSHLVNAEDEEAVKCLNHIQYERKSK